MDHDSELLFEQVVRPNRVDQRGPIAEFLAKKDAEQAKQTGSGYRTALMRFYEFLGEDATVGDIHEAVGFRYLAHLRSQGLSENSVATYFKWLKAFTRWMAKKGWTERDRFADVKRPKFVRPKFDTLSVEQKQAILSTFSPDGFLGSRNLAIFCMFMDTGVRLEELAHLQAARVHLTEHYIEVFSQKTDEWRVIPLSDEAAAVCHNYLKWRTKLATTPIRQRISKDDMNHRRKIARQDLADTFFVAWNGEPLTENAVGLMVRRVRRRLSEQGLDLRIHPHLFRHCFLTEKALDGENPSMVRRWAGHRKYEMTDYYFGLAEAKLAAIKPKQSTFAGLQILPKPRRSKQATPVAHDEATPNEPTPITEPAERSRPSSAARPRTPAATASPARDGSRRRGSDGDGRSGRRGGG